MPIVCLAIYLYQYTPEANAFNSITTIPEISSLEWSPRPFIRPATPPVAPLAPAPIVVAKQKPLPKKRSFKKRIPKIEVVKFEPAFETEADSFDAIDVVAPLDRFVERELEEVAPESEIFWRSQPLLTKNEGLVKYIASQVVANDYANLKQSEMNAKAEFESTSEVVPFMVSAPAPVATPEKKAEVVSQPEPKDPPKTQVEEKTTPSSEEATSGLLANRLIIHGQKFNGEEKEEDVEEDIRPIEVAAEQTVTRPGAAPVVEMASSISKPIDLSPQQASIVPSNPVTTQKEAKPEPKPRAISKPTEYSNSFPERIFGRVVVDNQVEDWLSQNGGHLELFLIPEGSRSARDYRFIKYRYPDEEFEIDGKSLTSPHRLVAAIYGSEKELEAKSQVTYPEPITSKSGTEKVYFKIDGRNAALHKNVPNTPVVNRSAVTFTAPVYVAETGNRATPIEVRSGYAEFVGIPSWNRVPISSDGYLNFELPVDSEVMVRVVSEGFYPTVLTIPTGKTPIHSHIYLISKDRVDPIIRAFTGHAQDDTGRGLVMGRWFNPENQLPMGETPIEISNPQTAPAFMPHTSDTGFFAFANAWPSIRRVRRENAPAFVFNVRPGTASYIEFGREVKKKFIGKIVDPMESPIAGARVRILGDSSDKFEITDEEGRFEFSQIDFPSIYGPITLEVEAQGAPVTWYNVGWDPLQPRRERVFHLFDTDMLWGNAKFSGHHHSIGQRAGTVIGIVDKELFPKRFAQDTAACAMAAELTDSEGNKVSSQSGPVSFSSNGSKHSYCVSFQDPAYAFYGLKDGEYNLTLWTTHAHPRVVRRHVVRVGKGRSTIVTN